MNMIYKIEEYQKVTDHLNEVNDIKGLAKMNTVNFSLQNKFKNLMKDKLNENLEKELIEGQKKFKIELKLREQRREKRELKIQALLGQKFRRKTVNVKLRKMSTAALMGEENE